MKSVVGEQLGPPENYHLVEVPEPEPGPGEIKVAVQVAGMGYVDALVAAGKYQVRPPTPYVPGMEIAGVVTAVGAGVARPEIGDRVTASGFGGGLAEYAVVAANAACVIPEQLDLRAAAGFLVNYTTAWHALVDRAQLRAGETVLVLGAAGGTGIAAVQVARMAGARVIAGASTDEKRRFAQSHGAHDVLDYSQPEWRTTLKDLTDGRGVDLVFDPVGGDLMEPAFRSLAWRGRHLVIGFAGGPIPSLPINLALLKGASLMGVDLRQFSAVHEPGAAAEVRSRLLDAVRRGDLRPAVGACFPLEDFRAAMAMAGGRGGLGKTVVQIRNPQAPVAGR
ncbi:MAG: NADPH:quinone oxidoreductase family protein [Pseudomonadales bacterium]